MITPLRSNTSDTFILEIEGKQLEYPIQELPDEFVSWNLGQRIFMLESMLARIEGTALPSKGLGGFGAHLPVYITHNPKNSLFPVNAANKGTGLVAKEEYIDYYLDKFQTVYRETELKESASEDDKKKAIRRRIETILEFYESPNKIDLRCLAGLEIWPGNTSKNFELDPRVSLHFLGMASHDNPHRYYQWQINCIWEKIETQDKRFQFGRALRQLTLGQVGKSFVPGHIPAEKTPIKGQYPHGWNLWVVETIDKGIDALPQ